MEIVGWVNGNHYIKTNEVLGILPIPSSIRHASGMGEYVTSISGHQKHSFLAKMQKTRKPVLPVHTASEKSLFRTLMQHNPAFNSRMTGPIWKEAVKVWNYEADKNPDISYKV